MSVVAVVGSTDFPLERGAGHILRLLHHLPKRTQVIVRADAAGTPIAGVDAMVATLAKVWDIRVIPFQRDPNVSAHERGVERTKRLVDASDEVIALFTPDRVMEGGTGMVCNMAMARDKKVTAYTIADDDSLEEVGDIEPEDAPLPVHTMSVDVVAADGKTITLTYSYDEK